MKLVLIRHGETIDNKEKICQGHRDSLLSEKGVKQAEKLGERFRNEKIDAIYSSDLSRASRTAEEIAKHHKKLEVINDKRIREKYFGEMQGKPFPKDFDWDNPPSFIEKNDDMMKRVASFFEEIYSKHKNQNVIVVSHGGTKRMFLIYLFKKSVNHLWELEKPKNTSVTELEIKEDGNHNLIVNNCTKHLE